MLKRSILAVSVLALFVFAGCDSSSESERKPLAPSVANDTSTNKHTKVVVAQFGDFFLYAPLYVSIDKQFFAAEGLDVSLVSTGGDEKTWAAVISGSATFGIADPAFVAISAEKGQPGKVISTIIGRVPFWGVTKTSSIPPFSSAADLGSHTVATFPSPSTAYALQKQMYVKAGLDPTNIREGGFGALLAMVDAGKADIALELEPNVSTAVSQGAHVVYSMANDNGEFAITGITTTDRTIADNPQLVGSFVCGLQRGLDFVRSNPDESVSILAGRFPEIDASIAVDALKRSLADGVFPDVLITTDTGWTNAVQLRKDIGDLSELPAQHSCIDNTFAIAAKARCSAPANQ